MKLKGINVAILAENQYEDLELWYPYYRLKEEGADVKVIGTGSAEVYKSKHNYDAKTDAKVDNININQFDAIIIPGGWAPDYMRRYPKMIEFIRNANMKNKIIAAICHAGSLLVSAGVLKGRTVTCFKAIKDDVINAGANYVDKEVVVDNNLVTSRHPSDLPAFSRELVKILSKRNTHNKRI
ncbi:MAG: type 1 glutamine amidotransferase [Thaumarchaeota archaeon]|nr:type 1 glutamine amidotransferase [Nitrososphaerota archaeon]